MKAALILVLCIMSGSAYAASDTDRSHQLQDATKACKAKGFRTLGEQQDCIHNAYVKIKSDVSERGERYAAKNYKGLSKSQAESKLMALQKEYKSAPKSGFFNSSRKDSQVDQLTILNEGWWIQKNILGARQTQGDPWFMECKEGARTLNVVRRCPLGKGGAE